MKKLFTLAAAVLASVSMWAASYVPQGILTVTKDTTIYCTDITAAGTPATDWVVVPSYGTSNHKYVNTNGDSDGNPTGIVDNLASTTDNVAMIQIKKDGNTYTSGKRVVLMHVRGIKKLIAHGYCPNTNRGMVIGCDVYSASLTTPTEVASIEREELGSMIVEKDGLDPDTEYALAFYAKTADTRFYAVEFFAGEATPICADPTISISEEWSDANEGYLVTLTNNEEGATLTYSVDGGDFQAYAAPFYVGSKAAVVAKASKEGYVDATVAAKAPLHYLSRILESDEFAWAAGDTVSEQYHLVAPNITAILNDESWQGGSKAANDPDAPEDFGYTASVAGSNNPSAKDNIPTTGCFYTFVPSIDGTLEIGAKINADKVIFVSEEGTLLTVKVNGTEVESGSKVSTTENTYGKIVFNVKKDVNYYFWGSGTKIPFFGFKFEKDSETAVDNIEAGAKAVKIVENGQLVIIKNGVRYNAQGTIVK